MLLLIRNLKKILSVQKSSVDRTGLGYLTFDKDCAASSSTKRIIFVRASQNVDSSEQTGSKVF